MRTKIFVLFASIFLLWSLTNVEADVLYSFGCESGNITQANFSTVSSVTCQSDTRLNGTKAFFMPAGMTGNAYWWNFTPPTNYNISFVAITNESAGTSSTGAVCIEWGSAGECFGSGNGNGLGWNGGGSDKTHWVGVHFGGGSGVSLGTTPVHIRYEVKGANVSAYINGVYRESDAQTPLRLDWRNNDATINLYVDNFCVHTGSDTGCYAPSAPTATLKVNVYYEDGTQTLSFPLGNLVNNQSYTVGVGGVKTNITLKRTTVTFNGSVLYDVESSFTGSGYPFKTNSTCAGPENTCIQNIFYGGLGFINGSGYPVSVNETLNGTIDEIITGTTTTGREEKFGPAFMIAWGLKPTMTFSSNYVANQFTPVLNLTLLPSDLTYADDANSSIRFSDGDFETTTNITVQWRVNGTLVRTTVITPTTSPQNVSDLLSKGNYSKGATLNVTAWSCDGLYCSENTSVQVIVGGVRPNPVVNLSCSALNKTAINCTWVNPVGDHNHTLAFRNSTNTNNITNTTTNLLFGGLFPGNLYNLTFKTVSLDGTIGNGTMNLTFTLPNPSPNITNYTPTNLTPTFEEGTNQTFTVNATDDDGNPIVAWFKDNVLQTIASFWTWVIGQNEQGIHNITAVANDTYGAQTSVTWIVEVQDNFPAPESPNFQPNGGLFRTYIPLYCASPNGASSVDYYDILLKVNNGSWENLSVSNRYGAIDFDITQYDYYTNFTFNCTAYGESGNTSGVSNMFTRDYINEFYSTSVNTNMEFQTLKEYTMSLYYDAQNPRNNVFVNYAYADCNGDGQYDYVYNYTSSLPSRLKNYYVCVFPKGVVDYEIGVYIQKNDSSSWVGSGCDPSYDYSNNCLVRKQYKLQVGT